MTLYIVAPLCVALAARAAGWCRRQVAASNRQWADDNRD